MYLSKVKPAPGFIVSHLSHKANVGDAYAQHQFLWLLFDQQDKRDFLFRYEQAKNGICYYVLSSTQPKKLDGLQVRSKPFSPKLMEGDCLAYTLRANPTKMLKAKELGGRGQRVDVLMHAKHQARKERVEANEMQELQIRAAREWLLDIKRQERLGVEFVSLPEVTEHIQHEVYKRGAKSGQSQIITFSSVNYAGSLKVNDPEKFITQLSQGIGRSKSMGCGLMLIRRAD